MSSCVVDSSAFMAVLYNEPGTEAVVGHLPRAAISSVNFAEIVGKLCEDGTPEAEARAHILEFGLEVVTFDLDQAAIAGGLRPSTRAFGLSLGDRACLALAQLRGLPVLTADRAWTGLASFDITIIR